jgi:hypothetical protein
MSAIPAQLVRRNTGEVVDAVLHVDLHAAKLVETENAWGPLRRDAARSLLKAGHAEAVPHHWHWSWEAKSQKLKFLAYRCFGIECEGKMQGLMMTLAIGKVAMLPPDAGKPLVYIDFLENAPWNVRPLTDEPLFGGVGMVLMRAAATLSIDEGFHGRLGLHSLRQAEEFYRDKCGMQYCRDDPGYQNLPYYEFTREQSEKFLHG